MRLGLVILLVGALGLTGCASIGSMPYGNSTKTVLEKDNYTVKETAVTGESKGFDLLFIPLKPPKYSKAMEDLHSKVDMKGKSSALANVAQERSYDWWILFGIPRITVTADVVEFKE